MVVAGWTLEYLWESITGNLYSDLGSTIPAGYSLSNPFTTLCIGTGTTDCSKAPG